jgi:hypothetical protein
MLTELGAGLNQMLTVVERQEQTAGPERRGERLQQRLRPFFPDANDRRHARDNEIRLPQIAELDKPDTIGKLVLRRGQDAQGQPGLADSAGPAQRESAGLPHQTEQLSQLFLAADETIRRLGQVGQNVHYLVQLLDEYLAANPGHGRKGLIEFSRTALASA